jgi:hypothetical protein
LPPSPPEHGESMDAVLDDFRRLIVPGITHWNHPAFMAYFANSSTGAGVLGEALTAALNVNAMLWRTSPAATELELLTLDWLRQMLGLPDKFLGVIGDTASSNTLYALAAAREMHAELRMREDGMSGRPEMPRVVVYCSEEAHSSVDKAAMTLGFGLSGLRKIPTDDRMRMDAKALATTVEADRRAGAIPLAVVATVGRHRLRLSTLYSRSPRYANAKRCGCTLMHHMEVLPPSFRRCDTCSRVVIAPIRWWLTPTSGCSRQWIVRCCTLPGTICSSEHSNTWPTIWS